MKQACLKLFGLLFIALTITACGGGSEGGGTNGANNGNGIDESNTGGGNPTDVLRGIASQGGPMGQVEIVAVELGSNRGTRAVTNADGSFELNVNGLNRPLKIFATNSRTAESFALTNVAFAAQSVAHINEATHAVTQAMGNTPTAQRQAQLSEAITNALASYLNNSSVNFGSDPNYRADLTGMDGVLGLVRIAFVNGNSILLENRANPTQRVLIDTTTINAPPPVVLPAVSANQSLNILELRDLVHAFEAALQMESSDASKFDAVMHPEFLDEDGFTAADIAAISNAIDLSLERFEILRCFADTTATQDRCLVRIVLRSNAPDSSLDFGNPDFAQVALTDNVDVIVERRSSGTGPGVLKLAGGPFRPFVANTYLLHLTQNNVSDTGGVSANSTRTDLVLNVDTFGNNVQAAQLLRTQNNATTTLLNLARPANGQCVGVPGLVRNPVNNADCSRQFTVTNPGNLEFDSRNGRLGLAIQTGNPQETVQFPFVRVKTGVSVSASYFPSLNTASLQALHAYGQGNSQSGLSIQLSPPIGFNEVCIAADTEALNSDVCVRSTRQVSIPSNVLPPNLSSYVVYTQDNEGNRFARRYNLQ